MPEHDPTPRPSAQAAEAWIRYKALMSWMALAAIVSIVLALAYLYFSGVGMHIHMIIATAAGVGLSVLLGTGLMGLVYFSSHSGIDDDAGGGTHQ